MHPRILRFCVLLAVIPLSLATARDQKARELDRAKAYELLANGNAAKALPVLETLVKELPNDGGIHFRLGYALYLISAPANDPESVALRKRARTHFLRAQESGLDQPLIERALREIAEDGTIQERKFSDNVEANAAMQQGEIAFRKREFAKARAHYEKAHKLEPGLYEAALLAGNTYYAEKKLVESEPWFERAVAINPDMETAHRYWGDALYLRGKTREALSKYVDAMIADPYGGMGWRMLRERAGETDRLRDVQTANLPTAGIRLAKSVELELPKDFNALTVAYGTARATWVGENRDRLFPEGTPYRHSLEEEVHALTTLAQVAAELKASGEKAASAEAEPAIAMLQAVAKAGLMEPHVLFFRANHDIAEDYEAYRAKHRDELRRYLEEFVVNLK